ncbi:MAG TPA: ribosome assembly RNA-binding protein YhbY [Clostridia bacterium]|nr:ribosome assembly RNA-binding protein YhbY [Clostridia bacterium]
MLTSKQRSYLRGLANTIDPIFQVGKGGIGDNLVKQFNDALEARELIKATVLRNAEADARGICEEIAERIGADVVQVIGNRFVLYKESEKNKDISLNLNML